MGKPKGVSKEGVATSLECQAILAVVSRQRITMEGKLYDPSEHAAQHSVAMLVRTP
jgi:hypothetical protein